MTEREKQASTAPRGEAGKRSIPTPRHRWRQSERSTAGGAVHSWGTRWRRAWMTRRRMAYGVQAFMGNTAYLCDPTRHPIGSYAPAADRVRKSRIASSPQRENFGRYGLTFTELKLEGAGIRVIWSEPASSFGSATYLHEARLLISPHPNARHRQIPGPGLSRRCGRCPLSLTGLRDRRL